MDTLPRDMLLELLSHVSDSDLENLCSVDQRFHQVCGEEEFWIRRGVKTFGPLVFQKLYEELKNSSYRKTYQIASDLTFLGKFFLPTLKHPVGVNNILVLFHLESLELEDNELTQVPRELGRLQNLESLGLGNNQLISIPKEIGNLKELQSLYLSGNKLTSIPKEIAHLQNLELLYLSRNHLTHIPKELAHLKKLQELGLAKNPLTHIPKELGNLKELQKLWIDDSQRPLIPKEINPNVVKIWMYFDTS